MTHPENPRSAMEVLIDIIAGAKNKSDRLGLSYLADKQRTEFSDSLPATIRLLKNSSEGLNAELSFFLAVRIFWSAIPRQLFDSMNPNFEDFAQNSLLSLGLSSQHAPKLAVIFRRLRYSYRNGRPDSHFDLEKEVHRSLFLSQRRRCALCNYPFSASDEMYRLDDEDEHYLCHHQAREGEVVLQKYFRRPVLDHIIPYYLGGDGIDNWQILCQSCNLGKGESLSWLARRGWAPATKVSDLLNLTASLRYALLADFRAKSTDVCDRDEIRLFKKRVDRLIYYDNLYATH